MKIPKVDAMSNSLSNFMKRHKSLFDSVIIKGISIAIIWICALIPAWFYLLIRWLIGPEGFWQEFAIFCVMAFIIGWLQFILVFVGFGLSMVILMEEV